MSTSAPTANDISRPSIMRTARNGAFFTLLGIGLTQGLRLGSNLIMASFLDKEAFGLMGIALTVGFAVSMLTDIGINSSIVRSESGDDPAFLRTAWVTAIIRNTLVFGVVCLIALGLFFASDSMPADSIYAQPILPAFVALAATQVFISGFVSSNFALAQRHLTVGIVIAYELIAQVVAVVAMVSAAALGAGPWSLIVGAIAGASSQVLLSHTMLPGPAMAFEWHRQHFGEIFSFGKWLLLSSAFGFVMSRGDQLIFGYLFEAGIFSLYVIGTLWIIALKGVAGGMLQRVCYPALSRAVREGRGEVVTIYRQFRLYADLAAVGVFSCVVVLIEPFFEIAYPESYEGAVPFVRVLALSLLILPYRLVTTVILSTGDSRRYTFVTGLPAILLVVVLPLAHAAGGPLVAAAAYALIPLGTLVSSWTIARRTMPLSIWVEIRMVVLMIGIAVAYFTLS